MKYVAVIMFFLSSINAQSLIEGRWHLVGFEDAIMYQFVDTEPYADAGLRYSIYVDENGEFDDLDGDNIGGTPHPYSIVGDVITIDTHFGNILSYQMNYTCDGQVVELIDQGVTHSTLFREGYNYVDDNCIDYLEDCCEAEYLANNECDGVGCYIPQCTEDCAWEPMQCWGSTGYCWCVDDYGTEIEGTSIPSWQGLPDCATSSCDSGYTEINDLCFYEQDIQFLQQMIDNSYESNIELPCNEYDSQYCGSPNPYMDSSDSWMWVAVDGNTYQWTPNENGVVDPLELGIQEWENGRLTSLMCGAYIYCELSGPIPYEINTLTELKTFRVEGNYFSGIIPETICDLDIDYDNMLEFDVRYNQLCEPYPYCIDNNDDFWGQYDEGCSEIGDVNYDGTINVLDVISITSIILSNDTLDYQAMLMSDVNYDGLIDVLDIIIVIEIILN